MLKKVLPWLLGFILGAMAVLIPMLIWSYQVAETEKQQQKQTMFPGILFLGGVCLAPVAGLVGSLVLGFLSWLVLGGKPRQNSRDSAVQGKT